MTTHRMDSETVERLLDGTVVDPRDGRHPLAPLLSAVRAAPKPGELAGEAAAVRAYRLARLGTPVTVPGERRHGFAFARFGARAALVGLLLAGTGGVALAAAGGALPNPLRPSAPPASPSASAPTSAGVPTDGSDPRPATPSAGPSRPDPDTSMAGLCRTYRADAGDNLGRTLDNPVFGDLIDAAGGRDEVSGYCERVLAAEPGTDPGATPTARPGNQPTLRPTGRATQPPTAATGIPTDDPAPGNDPRTPSPPNGPK